MRAIQKKGCLLLVASVGEFLRAILIRPIIGTATIAIFLNEVACQCLPYIRLNFVCQSSVHDKNRGLTEGLSHLRASKTAMVVMYHQNGLLVAGLDSKGAGDG